MISVSATLPSNEALAAWAAAASTAGAVLPGRVAHVLSGSHWGRHGHQYNTDPEDGLWDPFAILEGVAAACRSIYRESDPRQIMPRGMQMCIDPEGRVALVWESDSHTVSLRFGGGWSTADLPGRGGPNQTPHWAPDLSRARLDIDIEGSVEFPDESPRVAAAVAASPTLQQQGWD